MAQPGDMQLSDGAWSFYEYYPEIEQSGWTPFEPEISAWLSQRYDSVSGEGANQQLGMRGADGTVPLLQVKEGLTLASQQGAFSAPRDSGDGGPRDKPQKKSFRERFLEAWATWSDLPWPPYIENEPDFGLDGKVVGPFMEYFEALDADNREPQSFTLDNGEVYTVLPGGKVIKEGTIDSETGKLTKTSGSAEVFIDDATKRTFIRNPDGTIEYVPDQKVPTEQGEGTFKYDKVLGRFVITQPDGSIQFGPEPTQEAKIKTDATGRRYVTQPNGTIQFLDREFEPGVVQEDGFNLLQQPSGAMSQLGLPPAPADTETIGGIQFIRTSTGELMPLDNVMKRMKENMVVTGNFEGAAAVHAWETRPSNQEYFDRMLGYVNAPAAQLLVSAIARGQGLVAPPPEETIQRIGPPPEYLTEAFNMLRDQMRMGLPEGTKSFADQMAEQAEELRIESLALDNAAKQQNIENAAVVASDAHEAAVTSNEAAVATNATNATNAGFSVANQEIDLDERLADDDDDVPVAREGQLFSEFEGVQGAQATKYSELAQRWVDYFGEDDRGRLHSAIAGLTQDEAIDWMKKPGNWELTGLTPVDPNVPHPIFDAEGNLIPVEVTTPAVTEMPTQIPPEEAEEVVPQVVTPTPTPTQVPSEEAGEEVAPLTFEQAVQSLQAEGAAGAETVFTDPDPAPTPAPTYAPSEEAAPVAAAPAMTTEQALASFGVPSSQMDSYAGTSPAMSTNVWDTSNEDDWFAGGGRYDDNTAIVGESGPELAIFPRGTEIVPLDRRMRPSQANRLRRRGVRGMQEGGIVFDNPLDNPLPLGIRQLQAGRSLGAPRGQLLRTAGIALPSAQAQRRMLPSEQEAFAGLGRMAGIPAEEFQQELGITTPSGAPRTGSARMLPLSLRR